jgi:hypothetical protein
VNFGIIGISNFPAVGAQESKPPLVVNNDYNKRFRPGLETFSTADNIPTFSNSFCLFLSANQEEMGENQVKEFRS